MSRRGGREIILRRLGSGGGEFGGWMGVSHTLWLLQGSPYVSGQYVCHVCWEKGSGPLYHCADCQLDFHVTCAAAAAGTGGGHVAQTHFSHFEHPLLLKSISSGDQVVCDGCGESHGGSSSWVYRCSHCDFDLCPLCVRAPRFLRHISHPHILVLSNLDELGSSCQCDGCRQPAKGMMYRCTSCNFDLHVSCTRLPLKPILALHPDHPLTLLFKEDDTWQSSYTCNVCGHEGRGWSYSCSICSLYVHPSCGKVHHELPRTSSSNNYGLSHLKNIEPKVAQRANVLHTNFNNFLNPHSLTINSPSSNILTRNSSNSLLNRSYSASSSFHDPLLSPRSFHEPLSSPRSFHEHTSPYPYLHNYSNTSLDRSLHSYSSPRAHGEIWNANYVSTNAIAQALSNRLTPMSPQDVDAVDRVMGMLRHNGSPPYF